MTSRLVLHRSSHSPDRALVRDLRAAIGTSKVHDDSAHRSLFAHDASVFDAGQSGPVCYAESHADVQEVVRLAAKHDRPVVPRGAGTGLAGGAIPLGGAIVLSTARMNRILEIDIDNRIAWVEPGVVNLELSRALRPNGYHFAPDPSSQQVCTIGGNVANNSGGPHCLAYGVTNAHVVAVEVVLASGATARLGGVDSEPAGLDLRGVFVGGEGMLGIATKIAVVLTPNPPAVRTLLIAFPTVRSSAECVSSIIGRGIVPAALEIMDNRCIQAVENYVKAGYPRDAAAALLVEIEGLPGGVEIDVSSVSTCAREHGATDIRIAASDAERELIWKGRKTAFGATAQIAPKYYLHDTVIPRTQLANVLDQVYDIAERNDLKVMNVFHAGDGNLHPLLLFDPLEPDIQRRVHDAGEEIVRVSLEAGGVLSGEHGIGLEKQKYMLDMFAPVDLDHQERVRRAFDPDCRANPGKVIPAGHSCADIQALHSTPPGVWG